jgi:hypothetical protein
LDDWIDDRDMRLLVSIRQGIASDSQGGVGFGLRLLASGLFAQAPKLAGRMMTTATARAHLRAFGQRLWDSATSWRAEDEPPEQTL